jgi:hypothetical protein
MTGNDTNFEVVYPLSVRLLFAFLYTTKSLWGWMWSEEAFVFGIINLQWCSELFIYNNPYIEPIRNLKTI